MKPENVLPCSAYALDESGKWKRTAWVSGLYFGLVMLLIELSSDRRSIEGDVIQYVRLALIFLFYSLGFGVFLSLALREYTIRIYAGLYNGEDWIFERPEGEECFRYRLPAALVIGSKRPVSGVLHLGQPGLFFVPSRKSSAKHRPIGMTPLDRIALRVVDPQPQTLGQKLLIPHPQRLLEFTAGGKSARFEVPLIEYTAERLSGFLRALQAGEAESGS